MKTIHILLLTVSLMATNAFAQKDQRQGPDIDAIVKAINLESSKVEQFKAILEKQREQMQEKRKEMRESRKDGDGKKMSRDDRKERHEQMQAERDAFDEELLTVLNYEQLYKFRKYMRDHRPQRGDNKQPRDKDKE